MAKVTGALLSLSARGTIASTLTYASWKGIDYARTRVIPANPRSTGQTLTRNVFSFLQSYYKEQPAIAREPWAAAVTGQQMTTMNLIISKNLSNIRTATDLADMTWSPGNGGGLPPAAITVTPGTNDLVIAVTAPAAPTGWTLVAAQAVAMKDQDPHVAIASVPVAGEDTTSTYSITLAGLTTGSLYRVGVWLKWLTASGNTAYSTSTSGSGTPT